MFQIHKLYLAYILGSKNMVMSQGKIHKNDAFWQTLKSEPALFQIKHDSMIRSLFVL